MRNVDLTTTKEESDEILALSRDEAWEKRFGTGQWMRRYWMGRCAGLQHKECIFRNAESLTFEEPDFIKEGRAIAAESRRKALCWDENGKSWVKTKDGTYLNLAAASRLAKREDGCWIVSYSAARGPTYCFNPRVDDESIIIASIESYLETHVITAGTRTPFDGNEIISYT